ncbi:MAG TPA: hypothetical protein VHS58_19785 [Acetobacteraceae bacterium]|jgi:hypothetical protein|nr:hypothetical protein [Acetobacteraceae bacterium]
MTVRKPIHPAVVDSRRIRVGASWKLLPLAVADTGRIRTGASWKLLSRG